jgi:hypothetical protein
VAPPAKRVPVAAESTNKTRRRSATAVHEAQFVSESQFARISGCGRTTIWRLRKSGKLKFIQISPRLVRIHISELGRLSRQYAAEQKTPIITDEDEEPP